MKLGGLLEYLKFNPDGFKTIEGEGNTGFDINEFLFKFKIYFKKYNTKHCLEFKFQNYDEISNETYLGLSKIDYVSEPYRYPSTQKDNMIVYKINVVSYVVDFSRFKVILVPIIIFFVEIGINSMILFLKVNHKRFQGYWRPNCIRKLLFSKGIITRKIII